MRYHGGTIFVDHYSGFTFIGNQVSLGIGETLKTKRAFERFAAEHGVKLQHFSFDWTISLSIHKHSERT